MLDDNCFPWWFYISFISPNHSIGFMFYLILWGFPFLFLNTLRWNKTFLVIMVVQLQIYPAHSSMFCCSSVLNQLIRDKIDCAMKIKAIQKIPGWLKFFTIHSKEVKSHIIGVLYVTQKIISPSFYVHLLIFPLTINIIWQNHSLCLLPTPQPLW